MPNQSSTKEQKKKQADDEIENIITNSGYRKKSDMTPDEIKELRPSKEDYHPCCGHT